MQSDRSYSALSPVKLGDIVLSINTIQYHIVLVIFLSEILT